MFKKYKLRKLLFLFSLCGNLFQEINATSDATIGKVASMLYQLGGNALKSKIVQNSLLGIGAGAVAYKGTQIAYGSMSSLETNLAREAIIENMMIFYALRKDLNNAEDFNNVISEALDVVLLSLSQRQSRYNVAGFIKSIGMDDPRMKILKNLIDKLRDLKEAVKKNSTFDFSNYVKKAKEIKLPYDINMIPLYLVKSDDEKNLEKIESGLKALSQDINLEITKKFKQERFNNKTISGLSNLSTPGESSSSVVSTKKLFSSIPDLSKKVASVKSDDNQEAVEDLVFKRKKQK